LDYWKAQTFSIIPKYWVKTLALIETWQPGPRVTIEQVRDMADVIIMDHNPPKFRELMDYLPDKLRSLGVEVVEGGELKTREGTK